MSPTAAGSSRMIRTSTWRSCDPTSSSGSITWSSILPAMTRRTSSSFTDRRSCRGFVRGGADLRVMNEGATARTWIIVLIKDLDSAKQRLGAVLDPKARRALARRNAERAIRAAASGDERLVVAGSAEVAAMAERLGVEALLEPRQ